MSDQSTSDPRPGRRLRGRQLLGGAAGGMVAVVLVAAGLATGVVDGHTTRVVEHAPSTIAASGAGGIDARAIYARDAPGVAFIRSYGVTTNGPFGQGRGVAEGSGFALDRRGDILTNAHVVDGADRVTVTLDGTGTALPAKVLGKDDSYDLAVLHVEADSSLLHPLPLGDSAAAHVGDPVVAIGNPFGLDRTITAGIVSSLQRQITAPDGFTIDHVIQTDAAINPGNSGGPLIDAHGRVIGINSQIATGGSGDTNVGIGFAVPIDTAKAELPSLERGKAVPHPFLGVASVTLTAATARAMGLPSGQQGALIEHVAAGSAAARAGLRGGDVPTRSGIALGGDVVVALGGRRIAGAGDLAQAVESLKVGQRVTVTFLRHDGRHTADVTLGTRAARS